MKSELKVDAAFSGRFGVRFLRQHNFDFDLFAIGYLPLTNSQDVDSELPKATRGAAHAANPLQALAGLQPLLELIQCMAHRSAELSEKSMPEI